MAENFRFRPGQRLHQASEFSAVFKNRRVLRSRLFDLHWRSSMPGQELQTSRLGLVIPKRLARRAVMRNLMKRIAREAFRHRLAMLPPMDLVLKLSRKPAVVAGEPWQVHPADKVFRKCLAEEIDALLLSLPGIGAKPALTSVDSTSKAD